MPIKKFSSLVFGIEDSGQQERSPAPALSHEVFESLENKAKESQLPLATIVEVYHRGLDDWSEETNKTAEQYAFNRVNSFINGGAARQLDEDLLVELEAKTLRSYAYKAKASREKIGKEIDDLPSADMASYHGGGPHAGFENVQKYNKLARKYINRTQGMKKALDKLGPKSVKEHSNAIDISGSEPIKEARNTVMTNDPVRYATTDPRRARRNSVKTHTQREKAMYDTTRTKDAININFKSRAQQHTHGDYHLTNKHGDQLTDRFTQERRNRAAQLRSKGLRESLEYLVNRKAIHDMHAESSRTLAGRERHPEIRINDLNRSKKHEHASRVLDRLIDYHKKNKK